LKEEGLSGKSILGISCTKLGGRLRRRVIGNTVALIVHDEFAQTAKRCNQIAVHLSNLHNECKGTVKVEFSSLPA
jgi:hypothetical protein